jgi:hypothetical protein
MLSALSEEQLNKLMSQPEHMWWSEPMTLIFGKATLPTQPWEAIFPEVEPRKTEHPISVEQYSGPAEIADSKQPLRLGLGDPWHFYGEFRHAHKLTNLPAARTPEIAMKEGSVVGVPLVVTRKPGAAREITVKATAPSGWKVLSGEGRFLLPDEEFTYLRVELQSPQIADTELKGRRPDSIVVSGTAGDKSIGQVELRVLLRSSALPQ